jgi:hypothetical protein
MEISVTINWSSSDESYYRHVAERGALTVHGRQETRENRKLGQPFRRFDGPGHSRADVRKFLSCFVSVPLQDFARHSPGCRVFTVSIQIRDSDHRDFLGDEMASALGIHKFAFHPARKTAVNKSNDLNGNEKHGIYMKLQSAFPHNCFG